MRTLIILGLLFHGTLAHSATQRISSCERATKQLLAIPSRSVTLNSHREEVEAQIHAIVENGILKQTKVKRAELRLIPHWRYYRASYSGRSKSGKVEIETIADDQGFIQNYKLRENGKTQYWCRNMESEAP